MKKLALGSILVAVAIMGCSSSKKKTPIVTGDDTTDAGDDDGGTPIDGIEPAACNVLTQTGCNANEKCTWFEDDMSDPPIGHIGCAPNGDKAIGAACTTGAPGATGYDDCVAGAVCQGGECEQICDHQGGSPMCAANFGCVRISGLFGPAQSSDPPAAGVCEPSCNPIADNDFDGSGGEPKTGSACGSDPNVGCYGFAASSGDRTHFICAHPAVTASFDSSQVYHREPTNGLPTGNIYLNSCHPGYTLAFGAEMTGGTKTLCYAFCKPGNAYMGNTGTQQPNGVPGDGCNSIDRKNAFGTKATATVNGEHCVYSWWFEEDDQGNIHKSPTSDNVGYCFDHTKYQYDSDGDGTPDMPYPACGTLPLTSTTELAAADLGCVDSTSSGFPTNANGTVHHQSSPIGEKIRKDLRTKWVIPATDPRFQLSVQRNAH